MRQRDAKIATLTDALAAAMRDFAELKAATLAADNARSSHLSDEIRFARERVIDAESRSRCDSLEATEA